MKRNNVLLMVVGISIPLLFISFPLFSEDFYTHTVNIQIPTPIIEEGKVFIENFSDCVIPGNPQLPQRCYNFIVHPDINWDTLNVSLLDDKSEILLETYSISPVPPASIKLIENGKLIEKLYYGDGREIVEGKDSTIYGADTFYPENPVQLIPYSQMRKWKIARVLLQPVQYNPLTGEVRVIRSGAIIISYSTTDNAACSAESESVFSDSIADERVFKIAVNFTEMKKLYSPVSGKTAKEELSPKSLPTTYDYIIITTNYIRSNSAKLTEYVTHKQAQYYSVLVKTVEEIEAEYTRALKPTLFETTDQRADRIKAFLKDKYIPYGIKWVLLIGSPNPSTGDVPMKFCEPDQYDAPTDAFYTDLTGRWDLDNDTIFGEHPDDAGAGGVDFAGPELYVCRIPNYSTDLTALNSIFQKIITYENDMANESWRKSCIMPNPIDFSDAYGAEGNLSPVTMVEYIKNNALIPAGFSYYRILEHKFNWYPINVSPDPEKTPDNPGHVNVTYYSSTMRFFAALDTTSEDVAAYTIGEMTDNSDTTYYEKANMAVNSWLQFKQTNSGLLGVNYNPDRIIIKSTNKTLLPQKFIIQMASDGAFSDAYTIVTETDANTHAVADGSYWRLQYDYPTNMNNVSYRRYIRLKYTGAAPQATVRINEFQMFTEEHKTIKPYVIPEWQHGYGICYYNTHGSATSAADVIDSSECTQLDNAKPSFTFAKACQNAWPETTTNLCYSLLKNGAIAALAATRTSYGLGDAGYPKLFPRLCGQNQRFGQIIGDMKAEMALLGELGWGGLFADCMRFNLYGDPTVALRADAEVDGMPYWWELHFNLDPTIDDADGDPDDDGFTNLEEYINGTDPTIAEDADADGLPDGWEIQYFGNLGQGPDDDYDIDGLTNLHEYQLNTNPIDQNTDADGMKDGEEATWGSNPIVFTYFVHDAGGNDSYDGWLPISNGIHGPKKTIQQGMNLALAGQEVIVLEGTYQGAGNSGLDFGGKALTVRSQKGAAATIVDCEHLNRGFFCFGVASPGGMIDGFTIMNGSTTDRGGGVHCAEGTMTVKNCVVTGCSATGNGGGIFCRLSTNVTVINCLVTGNTTAGQGGGLFAGNSSMSMTNCTVVGNNATGYGGGLGCDTDANATVTDSIFRSNTSPNGNQISLRNSTNPSTVTISYSDVQNLQGGAYIDAGCIFNWGSGNIGTDPLFVAGLLGNYYLSQVAAGQGTDSPCLNTGSSFAESAGLDVLSTRTDHGYDTGAVDMGYHYSIYIEVVINSIIKSDNGVTIEWTPRAGANYIVQWSTDMQAWNDVTVGQTGIWTDTNTFGYAVKFYRVFE
jgi:hypothetical protein